MVIRALDRKLLRDLARMRAQAAAIALVVASGVALFVAAVTTYRCLRLSEDQYYRDQRFAHVWSGLSRAPSSVTRDIQAIPGVAAVEARIVSQAILDIPGVDEPASALLVSIPEAAGHRLNDLHIRRGRHVEAHRPGEVLVGEPFAEKNRLGPGDEIAAIVAGRRFTLRIAGVALSPEYVMQVPPGGLSPDDRRFAVLWMAREELEAIVDMRGATNDVAVMLAPYAVESTVIRKLDLLLEPYGGRGAYGRTSQMSHVMLEEHIEQLKSLALLVPTIFLLVAAFLVNIVLSRLIGTQREQIGMLKAFGYSGMRIATHYLELALLIVSSGIALGIPVGAWLGRLMAVFYATFFRFPVLVFRIEPAIVAVAAFIAIGAATAGALGTLRRVISMPPMVAMAPELPAFRRTLLDRIGVSRLLAPVSRMILRNITRRPLRAGLTTAGMALAIAVVVLGNSSADGISRMRDVRFQAEQREDVAVELADPRPSDSLQSFAALPGVRHAEPYRAVPARVHAGGGSQDVALLGLPRDGLLRRIVGTDYERVSVPDSGALVTSWLAQRFGLRRGDLLTIEVRERRRRVVTTRLVGVVNEPLGNTIYMDLPTLDRLLGEPETYSGANLVVDASRARELYAVLKRMPQAVAVQMRSGTLLNFRSMSDQSITFIQRIEVFFAVIIAFGVVYNSARIALAERSHELATLRVLGFTRAEISGILLGEIGVLAAAAMPLGFAVGYGLSGAVAASISTERMHMPLVVESATFAFAFVVFAVAALGSALVVRRRLDELDLVAVLKARE